jgi:transposase
VNYAIFVSIIMPYINKINYPIMSTIFNKKAFLYKIIDESLLTLKYLRRIILYIKVSEEHAMSKYDAKTKILRDSNCLNPHPERVKAPWFQHSSFFDPRDFLQVKYEMLRHTLIEGVSKSKAAKLFGVSRPTFYEAESALSRLGLTGLLPQQRGPKEAHKLNTNVMIFIEDCINKDPKLRAKDLVKLIQDQFMISIHQRSVERAISRKKKQRK